MRRHSNKGFHSYSTDRQLYFENINSITFYNQGNVTVHINSILKLEPKMMSSMTESDPDVIDTTNYYINFDLNDAATTGTDQELVVITKTIHIK